MPARERGYFFQYIYIVCGNYLQLILVMNYCLVRKLFGTIGKFGLWFVLFQGYLTYSDLSKTWPPGRSTVFPSMYIRKLLKILIVQKLLA